VIRVFPRRTKWTPTDELAFVGDPPLFRPPEQKVMVSVTFTWDIIEGKRLKRSWDLFYPDVQLGGPALGDIGNEFTPGLFLKKGVTITSRGCPKKCKYCFVPEREGKIREYFIHSGWIIQDNNLLACSKSHQIRVFEMLLCQPKQVDFNGGLDPEFLQGWHIQEFEKLSVRHFWFSCDTPEDIKYMPKVKDLMADYKEWQKRCYVLIGFNGESVSEAEKRLNDIYAMGFLPFAQLYQTEKKRPWTPEWDKLQRKWCRPAAYRSSK
jgi:hypothetical protein